mmetsp:Transcript_30177/g.41521  ORF Transcript_30177/g.41521 Transcript_30177/m.41521 type:complete len:161 (-) Transcript_30177:1936-2418(-)
MTMMVFASSAELSNNNSGGIAAGTPFCPVDHPLTALVLFLKHFADMDWKTFQVTATGPHLIHPRHIRTGEDSNGEYSTISTADILPTKKGSYFDYVGKDDTMTNKLAVKEKNPMNNLFYHHNSSNEYGHTKWTGEILIRAFAMCSQTLPSPIQRKLCGKR